MSLQQGCNEVRLRPGQGARLAPPCSNVKSFGRKFTVLKKVIVKLLGIFGAPADIWRSPAVIRRPHNDPATGELRPPVAPGLQFTHVPSFACTGGLRKSGLFYCWSLLPNNNMATNLQKFTLYCGSRRFVAWGCWTYTSWQVMQRDSDVLIAVNHAHLYFSKRSVSESIVMLPQVWKIHY